MGQNVKREVDLCRFGLKALVYEAIESFVCLGVCQRSGECASQVGNVLGRV